MLGFGLPAKDLPTITVGLQVQAVEAVLTAKGNTKAHLVGISLGA